MDEREYRVRLAHDVDAWQRGGLITAEQRGAILARAGAGEPRLLGALRLGWFVTAVSIVGAIVLAGGVGLFLAASWDTIPDWFRTALVFAGMTAAYALGYALIYRFEMQRIGSALLLLGAALYEGGLFIVADTYGLGADTPALPALAAVGIAPLAYLFGSRIILLLALGNATAWAVAEMSSRYPDEPKAQAGILVVGVFGLGMYAVGRLHGLRRALERFGDIYIFAGLLVMFALIYVHTFSENWDAIIDAGAKPFAAPPVVYVAIAIAAAIVGVEAVLRARDRESLIDMGAQAALLVLAAVAATWPAWIGYAVVFNVVFFAMAAALVTHGYLRGDERYVNFGLAAVALGLLTRYVDVFWPVMTDSAFFIVGGLLLLAVAFVLERVRRRLLQEMGGGADADTGVGPGTGAEGLPA